MSGYLFKLMHYSLKLVYYILNLCYSFEIGEFFFEIVVLRSEIDLISLEIVSNVLLLTFVFFSSDL